MNTMVVKGRKNSSIINYSDYSHSQPLTGSLQTSLHAPDDCLDHLHSLQEGLPLYVVRLEGHSTAEGAC